MPAGITLTLTPLPHAPGQQVAQPFMFLLRSREALLPGWRLCDLWHEACFGDHLVGYRVCYSFFHSKPS